MIRIFKDDRTEAEQKTHTVAVVGTDPFLSGWGDAENGVSYAGWACRPEDIDETEASVRLRGDMLRVRIVTLKGYKPKAAHTHIYVWRKPKSYEWFEGKLSPKYSEETS
jgi:hypothetical protein